MSRTVSGDLWLEGLGGSVQVRGVSSAISIRADAPVALISGISPTMNANEVIRIGRSRSLAASTS